MSNVADSLWNGWKLTEVTAASGGAEARANSRLAAKRRRQIKVLELIRKTRPDLLLGDLDSAISSQEVADWVKTIQNESAASTYDVRDQINFLALSLDRGRRELNWQVEAPAPLQLIHRESNPFTPRSFAGLNAYRDWHAAVSEQISSNGFKSILLNGNQSAGHRRLEPEFVSWGLVLFFAITRDGLINTKYVSALPLFSESLTIHSGNAWLELFSTVPEKYKRRLPPRFRWLLGPTTFAVLLRHLSKFGHPKLKDYKDAKSFTDKAWRQFTKAVAETSFSITACARYADAAMRFSLPAYLVNSLSGRLVGTSLSENRWRQLILGGFILHPASTTVPDIDGQPGFTTGNHLHLSERSRTTLPRSSIEILQALKQSLYNRRDEKRLSYAEISASINEAIEQAREGAVIAECVCLWMRALHAKKLKPRTLYTYLGTIGFGLLRELGNTSISPQQCAPLAEAYRVIANQAKTEKSRRYRLIVLNQFHQFLSAWLGFPEIYLGTGPEGITNLRDQADANLISETEYELMASSLGQNSQTTMGKIRYWMFVLGYRAGLRISEALSIQLRDVQLPEKPIDDSEFMLIIRANQYVDTKSFDSRRQLPLHLLLNKAERSGFEEFIRRKKGLSKRPSVMVFSESSDSAAPLLDKDIHPEIHEAMRRITGDPCLRYHHLRHTLANNLLLAYHQIEPPWPIPVHLRQFIDTLHNGPTRSAIYFISQILGHVSPETTLRSYVHCQDIIAHHYLHTVIKPLNEGGKSLNTAEEMLAPLLDLLDIQPATLRKWKQRFGMKPVRWLTTAFKKAPYRTIKNVEIEHYPEPIDIHIAQVRTLSSLSLHEIETVLEAGQSTSVDDIEKIFSLEAESYKYLELAYADVIMVRTRRDSTSFRHLRPRRYGKSKVAYQGHFAKQLITLPLPKSEHERKLAQIIFSEIRDEIFSPGTGEHVRKQLRFFHKYHRAGEGQIWVKNAEAGIEFIQWICGLVRGIRVRIDLIPTLLSPLIPSEQEKQWKRRLQQATTKASVVTGEPGRRYKNTLGTATLTIQSSMPEKHPSRGYTVRYALIMACILARASTHQFYPDPAPDF